MNVTQATAGPFHVAGCNCSPQALRCHLASIPVPRIAPPESRFNRKERRRIAAINRRLERRALGRTLGGAR